MRGLPLRAPPRSQLTGAPPWPSLSRRDAAPPLSSRTPNPAPRHAPLAPRPSPRAPRSGGGSISKEELGELMDTLGIDATPEEVDQMVSEIDEDNSGEIDFGEFVAVMSRTVNATYTQKQVKDAFKVFEGRAPPGHVHVSQLIAALTECGSEKVSAEMARELVSQLEPDAHGNINYADYVATMMDSS